MRVLDWILFSVFLLGWVLLGVLGTWATTPPFWYGAACVAVAGVGCLLTPRWPALPRISRACLGSVLLFWAYVAGRALGSDVVWLARQDLVFATTGLIAYLLLSTRFTGDRHRALLLAVWGLLILANVVAGAWQYFEEPTWNVLHRFGWNRAAEKSAGGFFESANHLCGFLTAAAVPLLGVAVLGRGAHPLLRLLCAVVYLAAGIGVALSTSRGGLGAFAGASLLLVITTVVLLVAGRRRRENRGTSIGLWLGVLFTGLVLVTAPAVYVLKDRFSSGALMSMNGRAAMWDAALEQWQDYPIFGSGARSYDYMERGYRTMATKWPYWAGEVDARFTHNDYLQTLGDYGLTGLLLAFLVLGAHAVKTARVLSSQQRVSPEERPWLATALSAGSLAAVGGLCVQAAVEFNFHIGINVVMTAGLLALMANPGAVTAAEAVEAEKPRRLSPLTLGGALLTGGLSLVLLIRAVPLAQGDFYFMKGEREAMRATELGQIFSAIGTLQKAVEKDPENPVAWRYWGQATLAVGIRMQGAVRRTFFEKALEQLTRSHELDPYNPYTSAHAGQAADYLRKFPEAEKFHKAAVSWGRNIFRVNLHFGDHLLLTGRYEEALGPLEIARQLTPNEDRQEIQDKIDMCLERMMVKKEEKTPPP